MTALTEFLLARIAEDEAVATAATAPPWVEGLTRKGEPGRWRGIDSYSVLADRTRFFIEEVETVAQTEVAQDTAHIARWDPARVLAECEAKRQFIAFHESWPTLVQTPAKFERDDVDLDNYTFRMSQEIAWLTTREYVARFGIDPPTAPMLAALAAVYADHEDYQPEWRV
jgi:hypothetical protein